MFRDVRLDGYFRGLEVKARRLGIYLAQQCDQVWSEVEMDSHAFVALVGRGVWFGAV